MSRGTRARGLPVPGTRNRRLCLTPRSTVPSECSFRHCSGASRRTSRVPMDVRHPHSGPRQPTGFKDGTQDAHGVGLHVGIQTTEGFSWRRSATPHSAEAGGRGARSRPVTRACQPPRRPAPAGVFPRRRGRGWGHTPPSTAAAGPPHTVTDSGFQGCVPAVSVHGVFFKEQLVAGGNSLNICPL